MRPVVHDLVEDALRELADEPYRHELWLATDGPYVSSFTECLSRLYDDSGLGNALEGKEYVYNQQIDDQLRLLGTVLAGINDSRPPASILEDPALDRARAIALAVLEGLRNFGSEDVS